MSLPAFLFLAGCAGDTGPARIQVLDLEWKDNGCTDKIPVTFKVRNVGNVTAQDIGIHVFAGPYLHKNGSYRDARLAVDALDAGTTRDLQATIFAYDTCFINDWYNLTVVADPANGPKAVAFQLINP